MGNIYRGLDWNKKEWYIGLPTFLIEQNYEENIIDGIRISWEENKDIIPETLGQYIGIKTTKKKKLIFEGDICRIKGGEKFNGIYEFDKVGVIKRQCNSFDFCIKNVGYGLGFALDYSSIEIIGNIHQNPEICVDIL